MAELLDKGFFPVCAERNLKEREHIFENIDTGVAIYEAVDNRLYFIIFDIN